MRKSGSAAVGSRALHFDIFAHQFKDYVHHGKFLSAFIFRKAIGLGEFLDAFRFIDQDDYLAAGSRDAAWFLKRKSDRHLVTFIRQRA